jgi:RNA polymerase sigma factor (sigma-70 family)
MERTDADLIAASRRGETAAYGQIIERYQRLVFAVAFSAVRDRSASEDIAQDTFVLAWSRLGGLRDAERLPAWLCGIARNVARAHRRRARRETTADVEIAADGTPFDAISARENEVAISAALERVPDKYREPLVMIYYEQQSVKEVARALGTSDDAIHQRLSRGRQYLAGDVERMLERPRPRRELRAAVLALLVVGAGPSLVEASPRPKGWNMLKTAAVALTCALITTTAVVASRVTSSSHAAPTTEAAPTVERAASRTGPAALRAVAARVPFAPRLGTPGSVALADSEALDCHAAASHIIDLAVDADELPVGPGIRDQAEAAGIAMIEERCTKEAWSQDYIRCTLGATDPVSVHLDCAGFASPHTTEPSHLKDSFQIEVPETVVPATQDTSCEGVARHMGQLIAIEPASLDNVPEDKRDMVREGLRRAAAALPGQVLKSCQETAWTDERRACMAAATTSTAAHACE